MHCLELEQGQEQRQELVGVEVVLARQNQQAGWNHHLVQETSLKKIALACHHYYSWMMEG
jgi:hypothetical protein